MEKQHQTRIISHVLVIATIIISLAIASFTLCIICEFKKTKKEEIRVDGKLCYLPESRAFDYGIADLICSFSAQVIGTGFFVFCRGSGDFKSLKTSFASILMCVSWISFFVAVILMGTATSMNRKQPYAEGWIDGTCYLVKNGVYLGSGILALIAMISTLLSCYLVLNMSQVVNDQMKYEM